jgi:hypothetical protein
MNNVKDNSECATLRVGSLPKSEKVTTVSNDVNKGAALRCVVQQCGNSTGVLLVREDRKSYDSGAPKE